jgi:hypothetical protein
MNGQVSALIFDESMRKSLTSAISTPKRMIEPDRRRKNESAAQVKNRKKKIARRR